MTDDVRLTIGQAFAARWIIRNYGKYKDEGNPEDLFEKISTAVDIYVENQKERFLTELRSVALKTADGEEAQGEVLFNNDLILKSSELAKVTREWGSAFTKLTRFPV